MKYKLLKKVKIKKIKKIPISLSEQDKNETLKMKRIKISIII